MHTGRTAARTAEGQDARAFTLGSDIVFGAGEYDPHSHEGQRLIAHELVHVAQQSRAGLPGGTANVEHEADRGASAALLGQSFVPSGAPVGVACEHRSHGNADDVAVLRDLMQELLQSLPESTRRTVERYKTISVAVVRDTEGFKTLVYSANGNWSTRTFEAAASRLGITRAEAVPRAQGRGAVGAPGDAEQILIEWSGEADFEIETLVTSRDFCADCGEAIAAEIGPPAVGGERGSTDEPAEFGSRGAVEELPLEGAGFGSPGITSALEGGALIINQALAKMAQSAQLDRVRDALDERRPTIDKMRREGKWVIVSAVMNAPSTVDLLAGVATTPDQLVLFDHLTLRWGMTRAEARNPPMRLEAAPPGRPTPVPRDIHAENRRYPSYDIATYPPMHRTPSVGLIRNTVVASRLVTFLLAFRDRDTPPAQKTSHALRMMMVPYDLNNPTVLDDLAIIIGALDVKGEELRIVVGAFGPKVLRSAAQVREDQQLFPR